jgi:hypothetical protein
MIELSGNVVFTGVFVWGGVAILKVLHLVRDRVLNSRRMVYNTTQHHSHTLSVYTVRLLWEGGKVREKVEGQQFTKGVENTNMTDCTLVYRLY